MIHTDKLRENEKIDIAIGRLHYDDRCSVNKLQYFFQ
jgi:hypothetical protein